MTYKEVLQDLAARASDEYINNSTIEQAAAMIEQLFAVAKGKVRILTGHFNPEVYDRPEIRRAVERFLSGGGIIYAILIAGQTEKEALQANPFIKFLRDQKGVDLFLDNGGSLKNCNHFLLAETAKGLAFRLETDSRNHLATGSFGLFRDGERLREFFDRCLTPRFVHLLCA